MKISKKKILLVIISVLSVNAEEPCSVQDSINITDGIKLLNDDILYDNILYTPDLYGIYKNEYFNATFNRKIDPHLRGCLCLIKNCIQFCCPKGQAFKVGGICANDPYFNVSAGSTSEEAQLYLKYGVVYGKPCDNGYLLKPEDPVDEWHLLDDGQLYLNGSKSLNYSTKETFCLTKYYQTNDRSTDLKNSPIKVYMCENQGFALKFVLYPIGK